MKRTILFLAVVFSSMNCVGQSLFFDNINNSTWKADASFNDSTIRTSNKIGLGKLNHSLDSLKVDVTIWVFKDGILTIKFYNHNLKQYSLIGTYRYQVNAEKGILVIQFSDNRSLKYKVGINSTASYASLRRIKTKRK